MPTIHSTGGKKPEAPPIVFEVQLLAKRHGINLDELGQYLEGMRGRVITLEGLIAAGKTSLGLSLVFYLCFVFGIEAEFFPEPNNPQLREMYLRDMKLRNGWPLDEDDDRDMRLSPFAFQMIQVAKRRFLYLSASHWAVKHNGIAFVDRSLGGDEAFANMLHESGAIFDDEWAIYLATLNEDLHTPGPGRVIYLKTKPETSMKRVERRANEDEVSSYRVDYMVALEKSYTKVMEKMRAAGTPIIYLNYDDELPMLPISSPKLQSKGMSDTFIRRAAELKVNALVHPLHAHCVLIHILAAFKDINADDDIKRPCGIAAQAEVSEIRLSALDFPSLDMTVLS